MRWMEKYKKCNIIQFLLILLSSSVANDNLLLIVSRCNSASKQTGGTNYHTIQEDINILKHKIESLEHVLESNIKHIFIIILASSFILKFFIGV